MEKHKIDGAELLKGMNESANDWAGFTTDPRLWFDNLGFDEEARVTASAMKLRGESSAWLETFREKNIEQVFKTRWNAPPNKIYASCRAVDPKVWDAVTRKIYKGVDTWEDPRTFSVFACSAVTHVLSKPLDVRIEYEEDFPTKDGIIERAMLTTAIYEHDTPVFFVSPDLLEAAKQTEPPPIVDWTKLKLPYEAAVFMMPKGSMPTPQGGHLSYIAYGRIRGREDGLYKLPIYEDRISVDRPHFHIHGLDFEMAFDYNRIFQTAIDIEHSRDIHRPEARVATMSSDGSKTEYSDSDVAFTAKVVDICLNLLLLMDVKPEIVERAGATRAGIHKKTRQELWTPNILGRNYKVYRGSHSARGEGEHGTARWHWRRGHWREQGYGPLSCVVCGCNHAAHEKDTKLCRKNACLGKECTGSYKHEDHLRTWIEPICVNKEAV